MKTITTQTIRAEVQNGYCYVRNMDGDGVIDALVPEKKEVEVYKVIERSKHLPFSQVWSALIQVKGVRFNHQTN